MGTKSENLDIVQACVVKQVEEFNAHQNQRKSHIDKTKALVSSKCFDKCELV